MTTISLPGSCSRSVLAPLASAGPSRREKELTAEEARLEAQLAKKEMSSREIAAAYTKTKQLGEP